MATKLYFHNVVSTVAGTLPASNVSVSATTPTQIGDGTNHDMDTTIGASQSSAAITTSGGAAQPSLIVRFVSDRLASQTFALTSIGDISLSIGGSEGNGASNFLVRISLATWRPSTGALVTRIHDLAANATLEPGTTETSLTSTNAAGGTSATIADGDVLICEIWRDSTVPGNSTARTNTVFFDGTTEASTTSNAAFINFPNDTLKFAPQQFGQALATIKVLGVKAFAQANAQVTLPPTFAQAQAHAMIGGQYSIVRDTFTRSITDGWGTADTGGDWTFDSGTASNFDVTGTQGTIVMAVSFTQQVSSLRSVLHSPGIIVSYQWQDSRFSSSLNSVFFKSHLALNDLTSFTGNKISINIGSAGQVTFQFTVESASASTGTIATYVAGELWNFKGFIIPYAPTGKWLFSAKVWKDGTSEPDWQASDNSLTSLANIYGGHFGLGATTGDGTATTYTFDNLTVDPFILAGYGQAQANISTIETINAYGQAQAFIDKSKGLGQALADIKATINVFAQAQADILAKSNVFAQSNADIKATSNVFAQAQADIKATSNVFAQANADILAKSNVYAQAQADILAKSNVYAQAQADIKVIINQFAQALSDIKATTSVYAQANSDIKATSNSFAQALSDIKQTYNVYAQAQADILKVTRGFAQAQAKLNSFGYTRSGQANAFIMRLVAYDDFNRTVSDGWGSNSDSSITWGVVSPDDFLPGMAVNGTEGVLNQFGQYYLNGYPLISTGMVQFDVYITADTITNRYPVYDFDTRTERLDVHIFGLNDFEFSNYYGDVATVGGLVAGDWVTVKATVSTTIGAITYLKAWKRGTQEPDWQVTSQSADASGTFGSAEADLLINVNPLSVESARFDNLYLWTFGLLTLSPNAQAQALIDSTRVYAQAQATIILAGATTYQVYAQAQALIIPTRAFGQANADIKATANAFAQARARIFVQVFFDTFTRTVGSGLGTNSGFTYIRKADIGDGDATTSVNGSNAVVTGVSHNLQNADFFWERWALHYGMLQFDFRFPNNLGLGTLEVQNYAIFTTAAESLRLELNNNNPVRVQVYTSKADINPAVFDLSYGTWYTAKYIFTSTALEDEHVKIWPVGTQEPNWQESGSIFSIIYQTDLRASLLAPRYSGTLVDILEIDNLVIWNAFRAVETNGLAQAQATIISAINAYAQANADIRATSNSFAQAQADIKTSYQAYGQAQADIKATSNSFAQANADIKTSYQAYAQAQADIKVTTNVFAQAQADIKQTYQVYAQANADIKAVSNVFAQAQGYIIVRDIEAFAQSQADIKVTTNVFAQAQADIKVTSNVYAQAQAGIKVTSNVFAQANSDIKATSNVFAQTQGYVLVTDIEAFAQANADIKATYQVYGQANARIIAFGVNQFAQAQGNIQFNGNTVQAQAQAKINAFNYPQWAQANADIKAVVNAFAQANADILATSNKFAQAQADILVTTNVFAQSQADIKAIYQVYAQAQAYVIVRDIEAFAQAQADILVTTNVFAQANADIKVTSNAYAQAQACIKGNAFGQANADILATSNSFAQAQAKINAFDVEAFGQANAQITRGSLAFGQAQAKIKTTRIFGQAQATISKSKGLGQAQADIKVTTQVWAQAQAKIKTTRVFGQALADIKVTTRVFAQALADIESTTNAFAQAQADIEATTNQFAQANADIKAIGMGFGQSISDIKATSNIFGQAQADIKHTYQGYAQANSYIKRTENGFGQAQGTIKATSSGFGQAQTDILATSTVWANAQAVIITGVIKMAQAQGLIKAVTNVFANAQAHITSETLGFGQAQGYILTTVNAFALAAAIIIKSAGYGQAQAEISRPHTLANSEVSDEHTIIVSLDDSADTIHPGTKNITVTLSDSQGLHINLDDVAYT